MTETLQPYLSSISLPTHNSPVYKDECVYCFDSPASENGLYICLSTFLGLCSRHLPIHYNRTHSPLYFHIQRSYREKPQQEKEQSQPEQPTVLGIGVPGGFSADPDDGVEAIDTFSLHVHPQDHDISLPDENSLEHLPDVVSPCVAHIMSSRSASRETDVKQWEVEYQESRLAKDLHQEDNGVVIPREGWQCHACDLRENLWLCLTCGTISCGRRNFDGSGGNHHGVEHYEATHHPLAVKLGTITPEGKGDVFSYPEDDMVVDPFLTQHLAHFGINVADMRKTDRSMAELELDANIRYEFSAIEERGFQHEPVSGPGLTGMQNLGNSCYMASVMQVLFSIPSFIQRYAGNADTLFRTVSDSPTDSLILQMAKLGDGLHSGRYAVPSIRSQKARQISDKEKEKEKEEEWMVGGVLGPMEAVDNAGKKTAVRSILLNTLGAWMGTEGSSASPDHPSNMSSPGAQQQQHPSHASSLSPPSQPDFGGEFRRSPTPGSSSLSVDDESHTETDTYTQSEMVDEEGFKVNPDQDSMRREYMDTMNTGDGDGDGEEDDPEEAQRRSKLRNIQVNMNRTFSEDPDSLKNIGSFDLGGIGEGTPRKSKSKSKSKRRRRNKQGTADDNSSDGGRQETKKHSDPSRRSKGSAKTISGSTGQRLALDMKRVHEFGDKSDEGEDGSGSDASSSAALSARSSSDTMTSNSSLSVSSPAHHRSSQGHRSQQHRSRSGLGPEQRRGSNVSVSSLDNGLSTPRSTSVNPSDAMKKAMGQLNKGQFPGALKNINKALSVLVKDTSQVAKKKNILICVRYKLLLTLLQHHRDMEKQKDADPQHNALLLVMLAGIPVKSAHRAICYKMAIKANMQCGNNATAARLIRDLLPITPSQYQAEMETKLRQCEEQGMTDTEGFPASAAEQDPAFCWKTFRLLHADDTRAVCNYCRGEYSTAALTGTKEEEEGKEERRDDAGPCPYCTYGRVRLPTPHS
eukprot:gb/GECH01014454.1/.p1 GENE.gb/GECH01014454.1/~~gb/GECH01014454.1/.p1  ORF type:complete len:973 (+),score=217.28 gb/GECH01014454.1/:1-2919(+)